MNLRPAWSPEQVLDRRLLHEETLPWNTHIHTQRFMIHTWQWSTLHSAISHGVRGRQFLVTRALETDGRDLSLAHTINTWCKSVSGTTCETDSNSAFAQSCGFIGYCMWNVVVSAHNRYHANVMAHTWSANTWKAEAGGMLWVQD